MAMSQGRAEKNEKVAQIKTSSILNKVFDLNFSLLAFI